MRIRIIALISILFILLIDNHLSIGSDRIIVGVNTHYAQKKHDDTVLNKLRTIKIMSIRDEAYWDSIEKVKGVFKIPDHIDRYINNAITHGIDPLLGLTYGNRLYNNEDLPISEESQNAFLRYAEFMVRRYKSKVVLYQVWNEWNTGFGIKNRTPTSKGSAKDYIRLLKKVYPAIKKIDPNAIILASSVARWDVNWIKAILDADALHYMDGISLNPYNYYEAGERRTPESLVQRVADMQKELAWYNGNKAIPLYITEVGWPSHSGHGGISALKSAAYLARFYLMAPTIPAIKGIWWYDLQDDGTDPKEKEHNFGLLRHDLTLKESFIAFQDIIHLFRFSDFVERIETVSSVYAVKFKNHDGPTILAVWTDKESKNVKVTLHYDGMSEERIATQKVGQGPEWAEKNLDKATRVVDLLVDEMPLLVKTSHGNVRIVKSSIDVP